MQAIAFCHRCRGMRIGWNGRYVRHLISCTEWVSGSSKLLILTALFASLLFAFPSPSSVFFPNIRATVNAQKPTPEAGSAAAADPAVAAIDTFLEKHDISNAQRDRIASAIVASGRKYDLDPRLIASVVIVESGANPFAISESDSVGMMQIHLKTWGTTAVNEDINLFKIEDNIDFGARILKNYIRHFGLWEGVSRYNGVVADDMASSEQAVPEYVAKVQRVYEQ